MTSSSPRAPVAGSSWRLQDAKIHFSEVVRRVHRVGPQRVTVRGKDEVVIVSAAEYDRLRGDPSGEALVAAMASSPCRDVDLTSPAIRPKVRDVEL